MAEKNQFNLENIKAFAKKGTDAISENIDVDAIKEKMTQGTELITEKANVVKDAAMATKEEINEKLTELDRMLSQSITDYNDAFTIMNDKGVQLFVQRSRALDTIAFVEDVVNSIANKPKEFETVFEEVENNRARFKDSCEFAEQELKAAREAAGGAGAGIAAGASVAFMAPTAAMWIATTFGTASTGAAISTLSGAAAESAALAWLGGGALAAGGGGMAAGNALLALAGPIGWTIAGATLLSSILIFANKKTKLNKQKNEEIETVKKNLEAIKEVDAQLAMILDETTKARDLLNNSLRNCFSLYGCDYTSIEDADKQKLGALVNNTLTLSALYGKTVDANGKDSDAE